MNIATTIERPVQLTETPEGVRIDGAPELFIPASDFDKIDKITADMAAEDEAHCAAGDTQCQHCGNWFPPRSKSGGRRQKFCGEICRRQADAEKKAKAPNVRQRAGQRAEDPDPDLTQEPNAPAAAQTGNDGDLRWVVPPQEEIQVWVPDFRTVRIEQISCVGDQPSVIDVNVASAVRLARMILWAAGFKAVGFFACTKGGNEDIEDGQEADQFDWRDPA